VIADLKPYPALKPSGVPWLGEVPEHWDLSPAFGAFVPVKESNAGMKERQVLSLSYGRIIVKPEEKLRGLVPASFETYQVVDPGDVIVRTTDLQNDRTSLRIGQVEDRGIITSAYLALRPLAGLNAKFGSRLLSVWDAGKAIYAYGSGLRQSLKFSDFKRMLIPIPPLDEQEAIVRFLDWVDARIGRAVGLKEREIALLEEQKQAIITEAVTRGLDKSVALKPSGVPWLGEVPEHWEVGRVDRCMRSMRESVEPRAMVGQPVFHFSIPLVQLTGSGAVEEGGHIDSGKLRIRHRVLLVSRLNPRKATVTIAEPARGILTVCSTEFLQLEALSCSLGFMEYYFLAASVREELSGRVESATKSHQRVSPSDITKLPSLQPPLEEQEAIVRFLDVETARVDRAGDRLRREIDLLGEYRTRLISDVVTGKLDVREAAKGLPEQPEELDDSEADAGVQKPLEQAEAA